MSRTIDITPDVSLIKKSGAVNYSIPAALAELVDNSIDERLPGKKTTIEITLSQRGGEKHITVVDDSNGMTPEQAEKAMVMAYSNKTGTKIGEFGLGMKTACSNLGAQFEIITATKSAKKAVRLLYDEDAFLAQGAWKIELEEVDKPFEHGTAITIRKLKVNLYAGLKDTILKNFGRVYKHFVAAGDAEIVVNGEPVVPEIPDTIPEYDMEIRFDVDGKVVRGWAGLASKWSGKAAYGFTLVRHNRVVQEYWKPFEGQFALGKIVGELHLDDFAVVNNKTAFRIDTPEWMQMVKLVNEAIADLKRESRKLANPKKFAAKDQVEVEEYIEDVKKALKNEDLQQDLDRRALDAALADEFAEGPLPFALPSETETSKADGEADPTVSDRPTAVRESSAVEEHRLRRVKTQLRNITIEHQIASLGRESLYKTWDIEGVGTRKRLLVTTNRDHPFYAAVEPESFMLWVKHNIVEAVAEFFTETTGKTEAMIPLKSDILKHIAKMKFELMEEPLYPDVAETDETA